MPIRKDVNRDARIRILAIERMLPTDRLIKAKEIGRRLDSEYDIQTDRRIVYKDLYAIDRFTPLEIVAGKNGGFRKLDEDELFL
jgi:hypothetical protein